MNENEKQIAEANVSLKELARRFMDGEITYDEFLMQVAFNNLEIPMVAIIANN